MIDNGSMINIISSVALDRLNILIKFLNAHTLTIMAINTLSTIMGIIVLTIRVGIKEILATYHVV